MSDSGQDTGRRNSGAAREGEGGERENSQDLETAAGGAREAAEVRRKQQAEEQAAQQKLQEEEARKWKKIIDDEARKSQRQYAHLNQSEGSTRQANISSQLVGQSTRPYSMPKVR